MNETVEIFRSAFKIRPTGIQAKPFHTIESRKMNEAKKIQHKNHLYWPSMQPSKQL